MEELLNAELQLEHANRYRHLESGMVPERVETLEKGQRIYHFASSTVVPAIRRAAAPWWWRAAEFEKMIPFLRLDPSNVGVIARRLGAIKFGFPGKVDVLLEATIKRSIRAFVGPGKYQMDESEDISGARVIWIPPELDQTYIPNLACPDSGELSEIGRGALSHIRQARIQSLSFADEWGLKPGSLAGKNVWMHGDIQVH